AATDVCSGDDLDPRAVPDLLARLVEKSLVAADEPSSRERRYRLLETVRLYAHDRLEESEEAGTLPLPPARPAPPRTQRARDSPQLDREAANLRLALETLLAGAPRDALRFCAVLLPFWLRRIDLHEAHARFEDALAAAPERSLLRAQALLAAAAIDLRSGAV